MFFGEGICTIMHSTSTWLRTDLLPIFILDDSSLLTASTNLIKRINNAIMQAIWHEPPCHVVPHWCLIIVELPDREEADAGVWMACNSVHNVTSCLIVGRFINWVGKDPCQSGRNSRTGGPIQRLNSNRRISRTSSKIGNMYENM